MSTKKRKVDALLYAIFKQFIAIQDDDLKKSQEVFNVVFEQVKQKMSEQCNYFSKYSSQVLMAGSVYDGIKVSKMNEFDIDIVIRLPINYDRGENGIIIENQQPGFVKMKIINGFDNLDKQPEWEKCHKVTREWRDSEKYFLQNRFRQWMHSIVQKALNTMNGKLTVNGQTYLLTYKESGPAYTLNITNNQNKQFTLDVDLVPVIRFMLPRWPDGYRHVKDTKIQRWFVVPKPLKSMQNGDIKNRCWRLSFQDYEREMIKGYQQFKTTIRLVKKLRDTLGLKAIASYYIKTIFLWKLEDTDKKFWETKLSSTFRIMVGELHKAIKKKSIPYFWQKSYNLIEDLKPSLHNIYVTKLELVLDALENNDNDKIIGALLNAEEIIEFKKSEFFSNSLPPKMLSTPDTPTVSNNVQAKSKDTHLVDLINKLFNKFDSIGVHFENSIAALNDRVNDLSDKLDDVNERLKKLEIRDLENNCDDLENCERFGK